MTFTSNTGFNSLYYVYRIRNFVKQDSVARVRVRTFKNADISNFSHSSFLTLSANKFKTSVVFLN